MSRKKCEVSNCIFDIKKMYHFPKCLQRSKNWLSVCGNNELLKLSFKNLTERVICDAHFEERFKLSKGLSKTAVPTLYLPGMYIKYIKSNSTYILIMFIN